MFIYFLILIIACAFSSLCLFQHVHNDITNENLSFLLSVKYNGPLSKCVLACYSLLLPFLAAGMT